VGNANSVANSGAIDSHGNASQAGILLSSGTGNRILNSGTVTAHHADGRAVFLGTLAGQANKLINHGTLTAPVNAVLGLAGNETVINRGIVNGDVVLGAGNDIFDGRHGQLNSAVHGGVGDDTFIVNDPDIALVELDGEGTDLVKAASGFTLPDFIENLTLLGGGNHRGIGNDLANTIAGNLGDNVLGGRLGNDTISGGDGDDRAYGGGGNDSLLGDDGHDTLAGGLGADRLEGGDGDDRLNGGDGNDTLAGGNDDDTLNGGAGNDRLNGNSGDDVLIGRLGKDFLFGQSGADSFVFTRVLDSTVGATRDQIKDFSAADGDRIDLSAIDADVTTGADEAFTFIANAAYSGTAGELRFTSGAVNSIVRGDIDGDGADDFQILVAGVTTLSAGDFVL
jgi:Ca2+-binding RTX toxin-like protein